MKQEINPKVVVIVIGLLVLTILGFGWRLLGSGNGVGSTPVTHPTNG